MFFECSPPLSFPLSTPLTFPLLLYLLFLMSNVDFPSVLARKGKASSGRSGVRGQQHDQNHRVWAIRVGHLVPLALPGGVCPPGEAVHVRVLPEVHEEPNYSAKAHGLSAFIVLDPGNSLEFQLYGR